MEILLAEDDRIFRQALAGMLSAAGYAVRTAADGAAALRLFRMKRPDLVLLDVMMPIQDGFSTCREIRALDPAVPALFLTAKDAEADELAGRGLGADDYIPKTVSAAVLLARLAGVLRRAVPVVESPVFSFGEWTVDPLRLQMTMARAPAVDLTERELALLRHFADHPGEIFSKDFLLTRFWGASTDCTEGAVSTALCALRGKLGPSADRLETVWGRGVRYRPDF
ncbi:MAG: response regulator transcription factor [Kiritimatiellia bacterium]